MSGLIERLAVRAAEAAREAVPHGEVTCSYAMNYEDERRNGDYCQDTYDGHRCRWAVRSTGNHAGHQHKCFCDRVYWGEGRQS